VASELVANAVVHVHGPCALELTHFADVLRVAVADLGPGMPDLQVLGASSEGGRGLHIVSAFSTAWGVDHLDDGAKLVWAELNPVGVGVA
jgi:anti-sigma regulatory factor (Ser/Thr protein kinase)